MDDTILSSKVKWMEPTTKIERDPEKNEISRNHESWSGTSIFIWFPVVEAWVVDVGFMKMLGFLCLSSGIYKKYKNVRLNSFNFSKEHAHTPTNSNTINDIYFIFVWWIEFCLILVYNLISILFWRAWIKNENGTNTKKCQSK